MKMIEEVFEYVQDLQVKWVMVGLEDEVSSPVDVNNRGLTAHDAYTRLEQSSSHKEEKR
jgi:hypothetical protein